MAMVLSNQSRLLVAVCFCSLVLAGALTVSSLAGWLQHQEPVQPKQARLLQGALDQLKIYEDPDIAASQCKTDFQGFESDTENAIDNEIDRNGFESTMREGGDSESITFIPPPPPPPDGKNCICEQENCCNSVFNNDIQGDGYMKGEKGERGPRGPPGESIRGPPGPPGTPGIPGTTAPEGVCSCNITSLLTSSMIPNMLPGPPGIPGAEGKQGPPGITGQPGAPGERGAVGPLGEKGERGERGPPGPEGIQGPKGESGRDGIPGQPGPAGPPGPPGPVEFENVDDAVIGGSLTRPGIPGPKGEPGVAGPIGPRGERGLQGPKGSRGEAGPKGDRGDRGFPGERGLQGPKGEPGSPGLDGIPGTPGANGKNAEKGEKGDPGKPGPPGVPGIAVNPDNTIGYAPGQPGLKGEPGEPGPKGEKGDGGEAGIPGVPGMNGAVGSPGEKGEQGNIGPVGPMGPFGSKGEKGERGSPGPISVVDKNTKILTVKGDKGDMGKRGRRGKPGPAGPIGPPGKPGMSGEIGLPGWMGRPGPAGLPGLPGMKGEKGDSGSGSGMIKGDKGDKGDRGQDGMPGKDGAIGPPGPPGPSSDESVKYIPVPGPPGPPGAPGLSITGPKGEPGSPAYGEPVFNLRPGSGSRFEELKALEELKQLKELKEGRATASPPTEADSLPKVVPGAITFQDRSSMMRVTAATAAGSLAYIVEEQALLVRVNNGWQYIALGSLVQVTSPQPSTTHAPQLHPPFEAGNLINHISKPPDLSNWYPKMLHMAALNAPYTGDIHGIRGADYSCYREARRAGLRGTFRAFLSSRTQNLDSIVRLADRKLPVSNIKGEVLFNSWYEMFSSSGAPFQHPPRIYSFSGKNVLTDLTWPNKLVWHGGLPNGERALDMSCDAWHTSVKEKVGLAASLYGSRLLEQTSFSCDKRFIVLCVEATSEIYEQRRRRDINNASNRDLSEEEYYEVLSLIK